MLKNDTCPYTLLEVGKTDASRSMEDTRDADKVSSKYFTPFNHRMMQSSMDLYKVKTLNLVWSLVSTNPKCKIISLGGGTCQSTRGGDTRTAGASLLAQHQSLTASTSQVVKEFSILLLLSILKVHSNGWKRTYPGTSMKKLLILLTTSLCYISLFSVCWNIMII